MEAKEPKKIKLEWTPLALKIIKAKKHSKTIRR